MKKYLAFASGLLAVVSMVGINTFAQTSVSGSGVAQPGGVVYPFPGPLPSDNDQYFTQFNNLVVDSVSAQNLPATIYANFAYPPPVMGGAAQHSSAGTANNLPIPKCYQFETRDSLHGNPVNCPTPPVPPTSTSPASGPVPSAKGIPCPLDTIKGQIYPNPCSPYPGPGFLIEVGDDTRLLLRDHAEASLADFAAGDQINVFGIYNSDGAIEALVVRNLSRPVERQFIQLNNVEVVSVSGIVAPTDIAVIQRSMYPCYGFGLNGSSPKSDFPCPPGLGSAGFKSSSNAAEGVKIPQVLSPIWDSLRKYIVHVDAQTILLNRLKGRIDLADVKIGDKLNIYGSTNGNGEAIDADIVRDLTQPAAAANISGTVTQVNGDGSFTIQTDEGSTYTVQNPIQVGAKIKLKGLLDELQKIISQISEISVKNNQTPVTPRGGGMFFETCIPVACAAPPPGCSYKNPTYSKGGGCIIDCGTLACSPITASNKISITSINPSFGAVGTQVTLDGSGFASVNVVHFGDYGIVPKVISSDGITLAFSVPDSLTPLCYYSSSRCLLPSRLTEPGAYPVSVSNENGKSNEVQFTVTPAPPVFIPMPKPPLFQ